MSGGTADLSGRAGVVTGGSRGIGRAVAERLAGAGASILIADIDEAGAASAAEEISARGGKALACRLDVVDEASTTEMAETALRNFDRLDILVNNAGIMYRTRFADIPPAEWNEVLAVNLTGPFLCIRAVLPAMKRAGYGRVVNMSSSAGRSVSTLGGVHYTASKAGLLGLTRAVAKEVAGHGITVNAVCPGLIDTRMARLTTTAEELQGYRKSFPISRLGRPDEIGDLVLFLCSENAGYITGGSFDINGGALMI